MSHQWKAAETGFDCRRCNYKVRLDTDDRASGTTHMPLVKTILMATPGNRPLTMTDAEFAMRVWRLSCEA